jgi:hypothetical protein
MDDDDLPLNAVNDAPFMGIRLFTGEALNAALEDRDRLHSIIDRASEQLAMSCFEDVADELEKMGGEKARLARTMRDHLAAIRKTLAEAGPGEPGPFGRALAERDALRSIIGLARQELLTAKRDPAEAAQLSRDLAAGGEVARCARGTIEALAVIIRAIGVLAEADPAKLELDHG